MDYIKYIYKYRSHMQNHCPSTKSRRSGLQILKIIKRSFPDV